MKIKLKKKLIIPLIIGFMAGVLFTAIYFAVHPY